MEKFKNCPIKCPHPQLVKNIFTFSIVKIAFIWIEYNRNVMNSYVGTYEKLGCGDLAAYRYLWG